MSFVAGFLVALVVCWLYSRWCRQHEIVCEWTPEDEAWDATLGDGLEDEEDE